MNPLILIDGSYFVFYRYYALLQWWKRARPDIVLDDPTKNTEFIDKFKELFVKKLNEIPKKLKIKNSVTIVAKDCPQASIWRNSIYRLGSIISLLNESERQKILYPNKLINTDYIDELIEKYNNLESSKYKDGRTHDNHIGFFFKIVYNEKLFHKANILKLLEHPKLEADDCIALTIKNTSKDREIFIIANDHDYLQLVNNHVKLYNLKFKQILCDNSDEALFIKCVCGDKSDNISGIFKKCGKKTAIKYYNDPNLFQEKLKELNCVERLKVNQMLIDFNYIPYIYRNELVVPLL